VVGMVVVVEVVVGRVCKRKWRHTMQIVICADGFLRLNSRRCNVLLAT